MIIANDAHNQGFAFQSHGSPNVNCINSPGCQDRAANVNGGYHKYASTKNLSRKR